MAEPRGLPENGVLFACYQHGRGQDWKRSQSNASRIFCVGGEIREREGGDGVEREREKERERMNLCKACY